MSSPISSLKNYGPCPYSALYHEPDTITARLTRKFAVSPAEFTDWRWQMNHQIHTVEQTRPFFELTQEERIGFNSSAELFKIGISPYFMGLMNPDDPACPIRRQMLPHAAELHDTHGLADPLQEQDQSPVPEVIHIYPDRVAFCVAGLCAAYCRYCFRKRRDSQPGLHYNKEIIDRGIRYIASNPAIRDILITGGDPFSVSDEAIEDLLRRIRSISHVEIIRIGTRMPVTMPYRITPQLCALLQKYHPLWLSTQFNNVREITAESAMALALLVDHGIGVNNQSVFLKGVNNSADELLALNRKLLAHRVRPYYIFHPHTIQGTEHFRITVDEGLAIMQQLRGRISGLGIPTYALDTPHGKIPLQHNYILGRDDKDLILETPRGEIHREKNVL
jgi:lysine 2,3-aminomutase